MYIYSFFVDENTLSRLFMFYCKVNLLLCSKCIYLPLEHYIYSTGEFEIKHLSCLPIASQVSPQKEYPLVAKITSKN